MDMPKPLDIEGSFIVLETLKDEATESSKKAVSEILPRVYPSRRGISCNRCFPEGCGRKTSLSGDEVGVEANPSEANGLEHEISHEEGMSFVEAIQSDIHKNKAVQKILPIAYPPRRRTSATRSFPKNCGTKASQARKKVEGEIIVGKANDSVSQWGSMNHPEGQVPIYSALPVRRKIVLGLMASLKYPWMRGKGARKLKSKRGIGKGEKH